MSSAKTIRDLNQIYLDEVSADTALSASKAADKKRGQLASAGDKEGAAAKAQQASRLYKASAEKRKKEPAKKPDRSYPMGRGASYRQEDKDWGYDKDGNSLNPVDIEKKKKKDDDLAGSPNVKKESYETKKKEEVLSAMKRQGRKLSDKDKDKIANKVVTSKGDTSKSDDRYAYEELQSIRSLVEKVSTVNESRLVKKLTRPIRKAKKVAGRVAQWQDSDPGRAHTMGSLGNPHMRNDEKRAAERKAGKKKVEEGYGKIETPEKVVGKVRQPKKVDAPKGSKMKEELDTGMEHNLSILSMIAEKEVKVKDTKKVVDAIRAYDKSKDASRDATYDTDEGDKEKAAIEKKYAAKERGEIDKDDPNWKKRKYHTGIHGEEVESLVASGKFSNEELMSITNLQEADIADILARLEKKRISKGGDPDESPLGKKTGRAMKAQQDKKRKEAGVE